MNELRGKLAAGRPEAFARLYDALGDRLHHYLAGRLGSREDAADVLQETFVRLARHRRKLGDVENLTAYVFRTARNEAVRFAERRSRRQARQTPLAAEDLFVAAADGAAVDEAERVVAEGLGRLSPEQREVVELKTYAGLTLGEIADVLGLPPGTAASRWRAGLTRLRAVLRKEPL